MITMHTCFTARFYQVAASLFVLFLLVVDTANGQCPPPYSLFSYNITFNGANLYGYSSGAPQSFEFDYRLKGTTNWTTVANATNDYRLTGLATSTGYEWRMRQNCGSGVLSVNTATQSFTTSACTAPTTTSTTAGNITNDKADLYWTAIGATYELDYQPQGAANWTTVAITTNYYSLTGLTNNTVYTYRLRSNCSGTLSANSTPQSFTTGCQIPASPTTSGVLAYSALLSWTSTNTGTNAGASYEIDYRMQGTANWTTVTAPATPYNYKLTGLSNNTAYEWRMRSNCGGGTLSGNTATQSFTTVCNAPTYLYIGSPGVSYNSAQLAWSGGSLDATYEIDYRVQNTTNWTTVASPSTNSYFLLTGLTNNTAYEWRVRSNCGGALSASTPVQSFTTVCKVPTAVTVKTNSFAATVTWNTSGNDVQYGLQWRQGTGSWTTIPNITRTQYVLTGLSNAGAYQVQLQSVCGASSTTFSSPISFTATCPPPASLLVTGQTFLPVTARVFSWQNNSGVNYELQWRPQGSTAWNTSPLLDEYGSASYSIPNGYSNYTLYDMAAGGFDWQVRSVCADGTNTTYTTGQSFTVIAPVSVTCNTAPPTSYNSFAAYKAAILMWLGGGVAPYELRWRQQGSTTWNLATNIQNQVRTGIQTQGPVLVLRNLQPNTAYEWQVRTLCPNNSATAFGALQNFTTSCVMPANPYTNMPSSNRADISWSTNWGGDFYTLKAYSGLTYQDLGYQYELNWRQVGAGSWTILTGLTSPVYSLTSLANNTAYEWRVRNVCPASSSPFTSPVSFTTQCNSVSITSVGGGYCDKAIISTNTSPITLSDGGSFNVRYRPLGTTNWSVQSFTFSNGVSVTGLAPSTTYEMQVQNDCSGGLQTSYSTSYTYATAACPACQPASSSYPTQDRISTDAAVMYVGGTPPLQLRWRQSGTGTWTTVAVPPVAGGTPFYQLTGLTPGTNYDWQVRSTCSDPNDFSPITYFKTTCNIPFSPASTSIAATSAQLTYNGFGVGTSYEIRYRTGTNAWLSATSSNTATYQLTNLTSSTPYEWQIRTLCGGGSTSGWSHSLFFTTLPCSIPTDIFTDRIDGASARCTWSGAGQYTLQYRQQGSSSWTTVSGINATTSPFSYLLTGLNPQTAYEWQVVSNCTDGSSSAATYQPITFLTTTTVTTCTSLVTVQNGNWTDASTWSCNRIPTATDAVLILHSVLIPANNMGRAQQVSYGMNGQTRLGTAARLILGQ